MMMCLTSLFGMTVTTLRIGCGCCWGCCCRTGCVCIVDVEAEDGCKTVVVTADDDEFVGATVLVEEDVTEVVTGS